MNVDEARHHKLTASIDRFGRSGCNACLDRRNAVSRDRNVANSIDFARGVDDTSAFDNEVILLSSSKCIPADHEDRHATGRRGYKLTSIHDVLRSIRRSVPPTSCRDLGTSEYLFPLPSPP